MSRNSKQYGSKDVVLSCRKLESGLRFGQEGIAACALGPFQSPVYWSGTEAAEITITKEMLEEKRRWIFDLLNDETAETPCKGCQMVVEKTFGEVDFSRLGHIDYSATSSCNIRCNYCDYTIKDNFKKAPYESLEILNLFKPTDVVWDAAVDFGGGEPTLLPNFDECLSFFKHNKIRTFLYTNAVRFSQKAYEGLRDGSISWVCVSLDCGTPSTYLATKERDRFFDVMDNLHKYAEASRKGLGNLSVKYIFTQDNCSDDDISGFVFAMLSVKPDKVWLTFDFEPLKFLSGGDDGFGGYDYTKQVDAYVKLYLMLEQYGIKAGHFEENHLSQVTKAGKRLLDMVHSRLATVKPESKTEKKTELSCQLIKMSDIGEAVRLTEEKVAIVPCSVQSLALQRQVKALGGEVVAIIDRDPTLQGKVIEGDTVMPYQDLAGLSCDKILITCHALHQQAILEEVRCHSPLPVERIIVVED